MYKIPGFSVPDRARPYLLAEAVMNFSPYTLKRPGLVMPKRFAFYLIALDNVWIFIKVYLLFECDRFYLQIFSFLEVFKSVGLFISFCK